MEVIGEVRDGWGLEGYLMKGLAEKGHPLLGESRKFPEVRPRGVGS